MATKRTDASLETLRVVDVVAGGTMPDGEDIFIVLRLDNGRLIELAMKSGLSMAMAAGLMTSRQDAQDRSESDGVTAIPMETVEVVALTGGAEDALGVEFTMASGGQVRFAVKPEMGPDIVDETVEALDQLGKLPEDWKQHDS